MFKESQPLRRAVVEVSKLGVSKTDVHAIGAYRKVLQHVRSSQRPRRRSEDHSSFRQNETLPYCTPVEVERNPPLEFGSVLASPSNIGLALDNSKVIAVDISSTRFGPSSDVFAFNLAPLTSPPETPVLSTEDDFDDCSPEHRAMEWESNGKKLIADAFSVRRYLRTTLRAWRVGVHQSDQVLDALYLAEREVETNLELSVLVAWLIFCDTQRRLRVSFQLTSIAHERVLKKQIIARLIREWRLRIALRVYASERRDKEVRRWLTLWSTYVVKLVRPARQVELMVSAGRQRVGWEMWKEARAKEYLRMIHIFHSLEIFKMKSAFTQLKQLLQEKRRDRAMEERSKERVQSRVVSGWRNGVVESKKLVKKFSSSHWAVYAIYKLQLSSSSPTPSHANKLAASDNTVRDSILFVAVLKWREWALTERKNRQIEIRQSQSLILHQWCLAVQTQRQLRLSLLGLHRWQSLTLTSLVKARVFSDWYARWSRRSRLRDALIRHSQTSTVAAMRRCVVSWALYAREERLLGRSRGLVMRRKMECVWRGWKDICRRQLHSRVQDEMITLFRRKWAGRALLGALSANRNRTQVEKGLEAKRDWMSERLWFKRWLTASQRRNRLAASARNVADSRRSGLLSHAWKSWRIESKIVSAAQGRTKRAGWSGFVWNKESRQKHRLDSVLVREWLKRSVFLQLRKFAQFSHTRSQAQSDRVLRTHLKRWVGFMVVTTSLRELERVRSKVVLANALNAMTDWAHITAVQEDACLRELELRRLHTCWRKWRIAFAFTRLRASVARGKKLEDPNFIRDNVCVHFAAWRTLLLASRMRSQSSERDSRCLLMSVLHERESPWRLCVRARRLERWKSRCEAATILSAWDFLASIQSQRRESEIEKMDRLWKHQKRTVLLNWAFHVRNKRDRVGACLLAWWGEVRGAKERKNKLIQILPHVLDREKRAVFTRWFARTEFRSTLRERISEFSAQYQQRLVCSAYRGFLIARDLGRRAAFVRENVVPRGLVMRAFNRWVNGAVLVISLRDVVKRTEEILLKMQLAISLKRIRNFANIGKFYQRKQLELEGKQRERSLLVGADVLREWLAVASGLARRRALVALELKRKGIEAVRKFLEFRRKDRLQSEAAVEIRVRNSAFRLVQFVTQAVDEWRIATVRKMMLRKQAEVIAEMVASNVVSDAFHAWTHAVELSQYQGDLVWNEHVLSERVRLKILGNIVTFFHIVCHQRLGVAGFATQYCESRLAEKVMLAWSDHVELMRRGRFVKARDEMHRMRVAFDELRIEATMGSLARVCERKRGFSAVVGALRQARARKTEGAIRAIKMRQRHKRKQRVLHHWSYIARERKFSRSSSIEDAMSTGSYQDQRRWIVGTTPSPDPHSASAPVSNASTPSRLNSYRDFRPRPSSSSNLEQTI